MTRIQGGHSERRASLLAALRTLTDEDPGRRSLVVHHGRRARFAAPEAFIERRDDVLTSARCFPRAPGIVDRPQAILAS